MRLLTAYLMNGSRQLDGTPVAEIILESREDCADGRVWARSKEQFCDGRFAKLEAHHD